MPRSCTRTPLWSHNQLDPYLIAMNLEGWHRDDELQLALLARYLILRGFEKQGKEIYNAVTNIDPEPAKQESIVVQSIRKGEFPTVLKWLTGNGKRSIGPLGHLDAADAQVGAYLVQRAAFLEAVLRVKLLNHNDDLLGMLNDLLIPLRRTLGPSTVFPLPPETEQQRFLLLVLSSPDEVIASLFQLLPMREPVSAAQLDNCLGNIRSALIKDFAAAILAGAANHVVNFNKLDLSSVPPDYLRRLIQHAHSYLKLVHPFSLTPRLPEKFREFELALLPVSAPTLTPPPHFPAHLLHTLKHHQTNEIWTAKFSPLGKYLVLGLADGVLAIYDVHNNFEVITRLLSDPVTDMANMVNYADHSISKKAKSIMNCCWDPSEEFLVSSSVDTVIRVWRVGALHTSYREPSNFPLNCCLTVGPNIKVWTCDFLPVPHGDKPVFIVGSMDKKLKAYDIDGKELFDFFGDTEEAVKPEKEEGPVNTFQRVTDLAITPNGKILVTTNNDRKVNFYSIPNLVDPLAVTKCIASIGLGGRLTSCSVSTSGSYLLLNMCPDELQIWCISPLELGEPPFLMKKLYGHLQDDFNFRSCFGYTAKNESGIADEELALTGSKDGYVYIWKLASGGLVTRIRAHEGLVSSVEWNRTHKTQPGDARDYGKLWCSVSDDHAVKIWGPRDFYD